ncbi:helix-turn-helix transcriptional regulator [Peribacillus glennii]|uniref:WYL domain-containing protein n=1 Tax=Peribacillus glennii TaxID=2303991 RepID=A0A372LGH8_9BACI|nr:WYL domain-containing protein [Peribacillus glennii]RFU65405.1 WYL domain-containing protein [Peribacillus glennii]
MRVDNRNRLLMLADILRTQTDEEHELTLEEIMGKFRQEHGADLKLNRNSLRDDVEHLIEAGFDITINQEKDGMPKFYSHQYRLFELYELRMLIDAVASAKFITKDETRQLIRKIKELTSIHHAKRLHNEILIDSSVKSESNLVRLAINDLHEAISERRNVTFQYGRYNVEKKFVMSKNGGIYKVKPLALTWASDFYYLIAYYFPGQEIRHYRIDRLRNVRITDETYPYEPFDAPKYVRSTFHMYAGTEEWIKLRCVNGLVNVMLDKFGKEVEITMDGDAHFILKTKAIASDGLVKWLLNWGSEAKVLAPIDLQNRVRNEIMEMMKVYQD